MLTKNDTLSVSFNNTQFYTPAILEATTTKYAADTLFYTLVIAPKQGLLMKTNTPLEAGDQFTQQDINELRLQYIHNKNEGTIDSFTFVVEDKIGGWLPKQRAYIQIEENPVSDVNDYLQEYNINIFPNPTKDIINIQFKYLPKDVIKIHLYNIQGQLLQQQQYNNPAHLLQLSTHYLANGIYFLNIQTREGMVTKKVSVQR